MKEEKKGDFSHNEGRDLTTDVGGFIVRNQRQLGAPVTWREILDLERAGLLGKMRAPAAKKSAAKKSAKGGK